MPEVLPPIEELPEDVRPKVPLDQIAHAGQWAQTFAPSDRSFAQRFRHNRDIREYGVALQEQKAAAIEAQARTNQTAQNFFFRDKALDTQAEINRIKMQQAHELHGQKLQLMKRQTSVAGERERALAAKTDLLLDDTEQEAHETSMFALDVKNSGTAIGTRARAEAVAKAWEKFPGVEKETFEQAWKMTRVDKTPTEILAEVKAAREELPTATVTGRAPGLTITERPAPVPKDQMAKIQDWEEQALKARKAGDTELERLFTDRIIAATKGSATPAAPIEKVAVNPQTGERLIRRNGRWEPIPATKPPVTSEAAQEAVRAAGGNRDRAKEILKEKFNVPN